MIGTGLPTIIWDQGSIGLAEQEHAATLSKMTLGSPVGHAQSDLRGLSHLLWPRTTRNHWTASWNAVRHERIQKLLSLVDEFGDLERNWDGYGAEPISPNACKAARRFIWVLAQLSADLPAPDLVPKSSGTVGFEWDIGPAEAYLEIGNTRFSGYVKAEGQEPILIEGPGDELDERVVGLIQNALFPPATVSSTINFIEVGEPLSVRVAA